MLEVYFLKIYHWICTENAIFLEEDDSVDHNEIHEAFLNIRNWFCYVIFGMENWPGARHYVGTEKKWNSKRFNERP